MYDWLDEATRDNAQIVTANRRLVRVLQQEYATQQMVAGRLAWQTPVFMEWKIGRQSCCSPAPAIDWSRQFCPGNKASCCGSDASDVRLEIHY